MALAGSPHRRPGIRRARWAPTVGSTASERGVAAYDGPVSPSSPISLRQLEYFVAVADLGTIAAAAKQCRVSQSAISVSISQMESDLSLDAFHRSPSKRLVLTSAGRRLVADARSILTRVDDFITTAQDLGQGLRGGLRVGCAETLTPYLLPKILGEFGEKNPGLDIDLVEGSVEQIRMLLTESVCEVAITYWPEEVTGFTALPLYDVRPHVILPAEHRLAGAGAVRLADLASDPVILLDSPPSAELFLSMFNELGITPNVVKRSKNMETLRALVAAGVGFAPLLNRQGVSQAANGQHFVAAEIEETVSALGVSLVIASNARLTNRAQAFSDFCVNSFRTPSSGRGMR